MFPSSTELFGSVIWFGIQKSAERRGGGGKKGKGDSFFFCSHLFGNDAVSKGVSAGEERDDAQAGKDGEELEFQGRPRRRRKNPGKVGGGGGEERERERESQNQR